MVEVGEGKNVSEVNQHVAHLYTLSYHKRACLSRISRLSDKLDGISAKNM